MQEQSSRGWSRPPQVTRAVILLWLSLILGIAPAIPEFDLSTFREADGFMWWFLGFTGLSYVLFGILIHLTYRRHNWSRIVLLVLVVASAAIMIYPWPGLDDEYWTLSAGVSQFGLLLLDAIALLWLFTGPGAAWFSPTQANMRAVHGP